MASGPLLGRLALLKFVRNCCEAGRVQEKGFVACSSSGCCSRRNFLQITPTPLSVLGISGSDAKPAISGVVWRLFSVASVCRKLLSLALRCSLRFAGKKVRELTKTLGSSVGHSTHV